MAAAIEELRLLGSIPVLEGPGEVDGVVGEEGRPRGGGDDEEILRFMDSVDSYLLLMDSLSSALRQVCDPAVLVFVPQHGMVSSPLIQRNTCGEILRNTVLCFSNLHNVTDPLSRTVFLPILVVT
jgi:hypothetical protein